jgi:hypothetical protein
MKEEVMACDGTGFSDGVPCARCNPNLFDIYQEPESWDRLLSGVPLWALHEGVSNVRGSSIPDRPMPPPCHAEEHYDDHGNAVKLHITSGEALAAAASGFAAEATERGIEPDWERFDRTFRALIASVQKGAGPDEPITESN